MPLTKQQLLIPRVLCIGGKEGEPNDTSGLWITGEIYTYKKHESDGYECYMNDANTLAMPVNYPDKFPHLFKPLQWWYGRTVEEMPRYVNTNSVYGIRKVKEWAFIKGEKLDRWRVEDTRGEIYSTFHLDITPADESEYQEYQKQKQ